MEGSISALTLLCLVLSGVDALNVNIPDETYEFARGDNITLPCSFQRQLNNPNNPNKLVVISWSVEAPEANAKQIQFITYYFNEKTNSIDIKSLYEGRVSLDVDVAMGKANLKLSSITLADNKVFECRVMIPGDDEGKPADTARLVVLVAPSKPICKIEGDAVYGKNINLTCVSEEGSPPPTYKWESRDVRNMPRLASPRTTDKGGILSLYNISKDTSGYYICTSKNKIRSATCNITVAVMPPSMNIGSTAGIIGGVAAGLIILIIIICCCCCRKKKQQEDYVMGVREEEYHDKEPNGDSRQVEGQEDREDNDDSRTRNTSDRQDRYEERSEQDYDRRRDYDDRRSDQDDRRRDYDDRRSDQDDRRRDYDDRRSDQDDQPRDYDDRRSDYSDRHDRYDDRHERYDNERRHDDRRDHRSNDDRYDEPYDDGERDRPPVPANKPPRRDYDD